MNASAARMPEIAPRTIASDFNASMLRTSGKYFSWLWYASTDLSFS